MMSRNDGCRALVTASAYDECRRVLVGALAENIRGCKLGVPVGNIRKASTLLDQYCIIEQSNCSSDMRHDLSMESFVQLIDYLAQSYGLNQGNIDLLLSMADGGYGVRDVKDFECNKNRTTVIYGKAVLYKTTQEKIHFGYVLFISTIRPRPITEIVTKPKKFLFFQYGEQDEERVTYHQLSPSEQKCVKDYFWFEALGEFQRQIANT